MIINQSGPIQATGTLFTLKMDSDGIINVDVVDNGGGSTIVFEEAATSGGTYVPLDVTNRKGHVTLYPRLPYVRARVSTYVSGTVDVRFDYGVAAGRPQEYLGPVASRCSINGTFLSTNKQLMSRTVHTARDNMQDFIVVFSNWHCDSASGETAIGPSNLTASIEYPLNTTPLRIRFDGAAAVVMPDGGMSYSDPVPLVIPKGEKFAIRTHFSNPNGIIFANGRDAGLSGELTREGYNAGVTTADITGTLGAVSPDVLAYSPVAILGKTSRPTVFIAGDSRAVGAGDANAASGGSGAKGEVERSLGDLAWINGSQSGDTVQKCVEAGKYAQRLILSRYCTHVISNLGINDFGTRTAAQVQADLTTFWKFFTGKPVYHLTIAPYTTSTDSWATTANQTIPGTYGSRRVAVNKWLRSVPPGLNGVFDTTEFVESGRDTSLWLPNFTADGIHGNAAAYLAIERAKVIQPEIFTR